MKKDTAMPEGGVSLSLRVRYAETDQMRYAYYGRYMEWFEAARGEFCRVKGIDYTTLEESGLFLPVAEAYCRYKSPARYDDLLEITAAVKDCTRRILRMVYEVRRGDTVLAEGETTQILADENGRPRTIPQEIRDRFLHVPDCNQSGKHSSR